MKQLNSIALIEVDLKFKFDRFRRIMRRKYDVFSHAEFRMCRIQFGSRVYSQQILERDKAKTSCNNCIQLMQNSTFEMHSQVLHFGRI